MATQIQCQPSPAQCTLPCSHRVAEYCPPLDCQSDVCPPAVNRCFPDYRPYFPWSQSVFFATLFLMSGFLLYFGKRKSPRVYTPPCLAERGRRVQVMVLALAADALFVCVLFFKSISLLFEISENYSKQRKMCALRDKTTRHNNNNNNTQHTCLVESILAYI